MGLKCFDFGAQLCIGESCGLLYKGVSEELGGSHAGEAAMKRKRLVTDETHPSKKVTVDAQGSENPIKLEKRSRFGGTNLFAASIKRVHQQQSPKDYRVVEVHSGSPKFRRSKRKVKVINSFTSSRTDPANNDYTEKTHSSGNQSQAKKKMGSIPVVAGSGSSSSSANNAIRSGDKRPADSSSRSSRSLDKRSKSIPASSSSSGSSSSSSSDGNSSSDIRPADSSSSGSRSQLDERSKSIPASSSSGNSSSSSSDGTHL